MRNIFCALVLAFAAFAQTISAQNADLNKLVDAAMTPDNLAKTYQILRMAEGQLTPECQEPIGGPRPTRVMLFQEIARSASGKLTSGAWMVRYDVPVCGETKQRNMVYEATASGLAMKPVMPGNTLADPMLQNDVARVLSAVTMKATPSCTRPVVLDTRLIGFPENGDAPWSEVWTTNLCGTYDIRRVTFRPNDDGTQFAISAHEADLGR